MVYFEARNIENIRCTGNIIFCMSFSSLLFIKTSGKIFIRLSIILLCRENIFIFMCSVRLMCHEWIELLMKRKRNLMSHFNNRNYYTDIMIIAVPKWNITIEFRWISLSLVSMSDLGSGYVCSQTIHCFPTISVSYATLVSVAFLLTVWLIVFSYFYVDIPIL